MTATLFEDRFGFPREAVDLSNWRLEPFSRWSFQHVGELVPSAGIEAPAGNVEPPLADASGLLKEEAALTGGRERIGDFLRRSSTDAFVVMRKGRFIVDYHAAHFDPGARHLVFSISKSLTACLLGVAQDKGLFDPAAPVTDYVPEAAGSAFGDASVRHLLDMRVSHDFEEIYLDPQSAFGRYRSAMLWNPPLEGCQPGTMLELLASLPKGAGPHGGPFRYRSPNSDMLGLIVERATGRRYNDLLSEWIWKGVGACSPGSVTIDRVGFARAAGGVSMTPRDLARVGEAMRLGGAGPSGRLLPADWVRDTFESGDPGAWADGDFADLLKGGSYRNQWYAGKDGALYAIGIHGQWLYIDPEREVVIVKASSQPVPVDDAVDHDCVRLFDSLARSLA